MRQEIRLEHYAVFVGKTRNTRVQHCPSNLCCSRGNCAFKFTTEASKLSLRLILWERQGRDCFPPLAGEENQGSERVKDEPEVTQIESDGAGT